MQFVPTVLHFAQSVLPVHQLQFCPEVLGVVIRIISKFTGAILNMLPSLIPSNFLNVNSRDFVNAYVTHDRHFSRVLIL